jgi:hypothetical protein
MSPRDPFLLGIRRDTPRRRRRRACLQQSVQKVAIEDMLSRRLVADGLTSARTHPIQWISRGRQPMAHHLRNAGVRFAHSKAAINGDECQFQVVPRFDVQDFGRRADQFDPFLPLSLRAGNGSFCAIADLAGGIGNPMGGEPIFSSSATKIGPLGLDRVNGVGQLRPTTLRTQSRRRQDRHFCISAVR